LSGLQDDIHPSDDLVPRFVPRGIAHVDIVSDQPPQVFVIVLVPSFSMLAFANTVEPLRIANQLTGKQLYRWEVRSDDGLPVVSANGLSISSDGGLTEVPANAVVLACVGNYAEKNVSGELAGFLREKWRKGHRVGGICTGAYALAKAGILKGHAFTLHWESIKPFCEDHPGLVPSDSIYVMDRRILSCGGGAASTDMMLALIRDSFGDKLARGVADMCLYASLRSSDQRQKTPASTLYGTRNQVLIKIIDYIETHLAEAIDMEEVAALHSVSRRQVERLFATHVGIPPNRFINNIRLDHGRSLLADTSMKVTDVAFAAGFTSANHFARLFRQRFGVSPHRFKGSVSPGV